MGAFDPRANFAGAVTKPSSSSPSDADFGIIAQHEPVGRGLYRLAIDAHVAPEQAVLDAVGQIADHAPLEDDAVADLGFADLGALPDGRERPDVGVDDPRAGADDHRAANHRAFDRRPLFDDHLAVDPRLAVDRAGDAPLDRVENQAVR